MRKKQDFKDAVLFLSREYLDYLINIHQMLSNSKNNLKIKSDILSKIAKLRLFIEEEAYLQKKELEIKNSKK